MRQATWQDMWKGAEPEPEGEKKGLSLHRLTLLSWEEWVTLVIVAIGFLAVAQSLDNANWVNEMPSLYPIGFLGILVGIILAKTRLPEIAAHPLALAIGVVGVTLASTANLEGSLHSRVWELGDRLHLWADALWNGGISNDNLPFVVIVVGLTFITAYVSVWSIFRWYNPWIGLIPGGLALLTNISYLPGQRSFNLLIYLFCSLLLVSRMHVLRNARSWRRERTSYPDLLSLAVLNVTVWVAVGLLTVAWVLPVGSGSGALYRAWTSVTSPIAGPFQDVGRLFTSVDSKKGVSVHKFGSTLPLQGKVSLTGGNQVEVEATEPGLMLRAQTYDFYTAAGWKISAAEQITNSAWPALKPLQNPDDLRKEFRRPLSIHVTTVAKQAVILSASQPVSVDVDARVIFGPDPSDITSIRPPSQLKEGTQYQVDSSITQASPARLKQAGRGYPAWVAPYLQLPDTLPPSDPGESTGADPGHGQCLRQRERPREVPADVPCRHQHLAGAPKKDSVAYFLFTTQKGYFDYHASAMVVMLRTLGIPARLTVGYIVRPQDRKADTNTYNISEANAFAWPEVYFPGLGWIEFNPTPSEPGNQPAGHRRCKCRGRAAGHERRPLPRPVRRRGWPYPGVDVG